MLPDAVTTDTWELRSGFHALSAPVLASTAAARLRAFPPTVVKFPTRYTALPETARAFTPPLRSGRQSGSTPRSGSRCAALFRANPPTALKVPPRNRPPAPSGATALTVPLTSGNSTSMKAPVAGSTLAPLPVVAPTPVNEPPTYQVSPSLVTASTVPLKARSPSGKPSFRGTTKAPSADSTGAAPSVLLTR